MRRRRVVCHLFNFVVGRGGTKDEKLSHSLAAAPVTALVDRNPRQSGTQRSGAIIFSQMAESRHEAILGKVKRLLGIADESAHQLEYRSLMPVHDLRECRLPATQRQRGKFTVRARLEL